MSRATAGPRRSGGGTSAPPAASTRAGRGPAPRGYFARSELPLASLLFVLPLIILYEIGTLYFASDPVSRTEQRIIAFNLMQDFFRLFGATGKYLPPMAVVLILLCWHVARQDSWRVSPRHLIGMALESVALALPLVLIGFVATHYLDEYLPLFNVTRKTASLLVLSIGAGVYEELVFRLVAFTCLSFILVDVFDMKRGWAGLLMVVLSSILFSFYHYLGPEQFELRTFAFRTVAGAYFGTVFVFRGFGITAGTHSLYDIFIVTLRAAL